MLVPSGLPSKLMFLGAALLLGACSSMPAPMSPQRTMVVDPVELLSGREVLGNENLTVRHEFIEYRFVTQKSKEIFQANPTRYEVVDGGACGAMGALAGMGDARRYAVHDGRIYFFASDGCRASLLKNPARHLEYDDAVPQGTQEQATTGREIMDRAVAWAGGAKALREMRSFRAYATATTGTADKPTTVTHEQCVSFPDLVMTRDSFNASWYSTVRNALSASMASTKGAEPVAQSRRRAFDRMTSRWPVMILKEYVDNEAYGGSAGLVVFGDGSGQIGDVAVDFVRVAMNGATNRLAIERSTGRIVRLEYHGREANLLVGNSIRDFSDYKTFGGIRLPLKYTVTFEGKRVASADAAMDFFEVNPKLDKAIFEVANQ